MERKSIGVSELRPWSLPLTKEPEETSHWCWELKKCGKSLPLKVQNKSSANPCSDFLSLWARFVSALASVFPSAKWKIIVVVMFLSM